MHSRNGALQLSATDLSNFLGCKHRTALDMAVAVGNLEAPAGSEDPLLQLLWERGLDHEKEYVKWLAAQKLDVADLSAIDSLKEPDRLVAETEAAMKKGAGVIVQGALRDGAWFGKPDILRRVETRSNLGSWSYEVYDTKLSRKTKGGTVLQLSLYSDMVAGLQGATPARFYVVAPRMALGKPAPDELSRDKTGPDTMMVLEFRTNDYAAYFRLIRQRMSETVVRHHAAVAAENYPDPVEHCQICRWQMTCDDRRRKDDHISLVAGITRMQRRELRAQGITTLAQCAATWPLPAEPSRGSLETYENAHLQARLQFESRKQGKLLHELRPIISYKAGTDDEPPTLDEGLCRLPEPSPGDMFLDFEGDPYAVEGGREYLTGVVVEENGAPKFHAFWGFNDADERRAYESLMDMIAERRVRYPAMHVYHYASYEQTALKKLRLRYESRGAELDELLRGGVFVDLFAVVRQGVRVGTESYSIKKLEPLYNFQRAVELEDATVCRMGIEVALQSGELPADDIVEKVRGYNEDDCVSTLRLRDWLEKVRAEHGNIPRPTVVPEPEPKLNEHDIRVRDIRPKLLQGIPEDPAKRNEEQQARWLLAYLLDYHRREALASHWEYYRLRDLPEEDLADEPQAITDLEFVQRVDVSKLKGGKPTGVVTDRYTYPPQEMEIRKGDLKLREGGTLGKIVSIDPVARTVDVRKQKAWAEYHPRSVFSYTFVPSGAQEDSLFAIAERVVADGGVVMGEGNPDRAGRALLLSRAPQLKKGKLGPPTGGVSEHLTRVVLDLDHSVLPVQGPPGAGKTHDGAEAICALVDAGKKVGVIATSHAVIRNLLKAVAEAAERRKQPVRIAHKCDDDETPNANDPIRQLGKDDKPRALLDDGEVQVLGGTAWLWARKEMAGAVDVLFVDEAGQVALANVLAVSPVAESIVLLGDPQQLEQPKKAAHPDGVDVSALEHMIGDHATVPDDRGVFLPKTWRMNPAITRYTSEMFYEGRLSSIEGLEKQVLSGTGRFDGAGLQVVFVEHDGNRSYSNEEVETVSGLVSAFASGTATWTDSTGKTRQLQGSDILIVAPYNAQVSRLATAVASSGSRAGTVDKFQGQQAPIVIFSMATSRQEDAPRGMEFLYSLNRLNVATSRARCVAIVVANARLFEPECRTPRQMKLANALCRLREISPMRLVAIESRGQHVASNYS